MITKKQEDILRFCWERNITIYPVEVQNTRFAIQINKKGNLHTTDETFSQSLAKKKVLEYYEFIYNKNNKK